ncbi:T9SS type B sorting domain-containing protein [Crocinitomix algicola]|uniref:T9SS type B sorting domain-containing protein n=1 Tax=Crocinitomix algicola TaxID=1740263 RepID=UPI001585F1F3|nr:gliding motility-associated C-terminal domain-containing protein [Crocinitomix algicola]
MKKLLGIAILSSIFGANTFAQGPTCAEMEPICTDVGVSFTAGVGAVSEPGNDYGCLFTQPNPSWYYLEISEAGDLEMELFADSDIDFIIWGPFDDLADAQSNCGTLGGPESPIVDCSYSGVAYETPEITGAEVGEVYILLITNYAAVVQDVTLGKIGGEAETDCDIVDIPPCTSYAGTFTLEKNGTAIPSDEPVYLCSGDDFEIISNDDYTLPNDTIPAPIGDGIYTAQIMWLIYDAAPTGDDPLADPAYTGLIIPSEDLMDVHDDDSEVGAMGCGTYYFVPVAGDDGVGDGGSNDNGSVTWDKNGNGCYTLGEAIVITYACPITATLQVNCGGDYINGMDFNIEGGSGDYSIVNLGEGDLVTEVVPNGGTATVENLENGSDLEILITDEEGCTAIIEGVFSAPVINPITITPAVSCPDASEGNVEVSIIDGSGQGAPYTLSLNGDVTPGTTADYDDIAGTAVTIIAVDSEGCISDSVVTITSAGHFIDVDIIVQNDVTCFGFNNGSAEISANPVNEFGIDDGEVVGIVWTDPTGTNYPGDETNTSQDDMMPGTWFVTIVDDYGCEVTIPVEINTPAELDVFVSSMNEPTCYLYSDGSIDLGVTGGTGIYNFSWKDMPDETGDVLNTIGAGEYWGYVTDENGCEDSVLVIVGQPDSLYAEFTIKDVLCFGDSTGTIVVDDVFNSTGPVNYYWDLGGVIDNPPSTSNIADGLPAGTYLVTIQDEYCDNLYEITITENSKIEFAELDLDPAYCRVYGYQSGNGQVYAAATGGVPDYDYLWLEESTGETTEFSTWGGRNPGDYTITVIDAVGCVMTETVKLDSLNPEAKFTVSSDQLNGDLKGTEIVSATFTNQSLYFANPLNPLADTTFFWNFGFDDTWVQSNNIDDVFDTLYTGEATYDVCLVAINKNGCRDTACQTITVFANPSFIPFNVFSPDGDGINDLFTFNPGASGVDVFTCVIVDRWGNTVVELNSVEEGWNGDRPNGQPVKDGTYFYTYAITYTNGTTDQGQGNITVLRGK